MANEQQGAVRDLKNLKMERDRLYLEEVITDLAAGTIRRMTPIRADGSPDLARATLYMGQAQVLSAMGPLPIQFELEADNLEEAVEMFGPEAEKAVRRMVDELARASARAGVADRGPRLRGDAGWRRRPDGGRRAHSGWAYPAHLTVPAGSASGQPSGSRRPVRENSRVPPALPGSNTAKRSESAPEERGSESWTTTPGVPAASSRARPGSLAARP